MPKKAYKYFSSNILEIAFQRKGFCGVKCSLPKDYNDPFELFLGIDTKVGPEGLATYRELVDELPQYPTTCFSKSPIVAPMWAHYGQNHTGFVLEFDLDLIKKNFPDIAVRDVTYRDEPDDSISDSIARAAATKKPRHAVWLRDTVLHHAYFSKYKMWSYEEEVRLVASDDDIDRNDENTILYFPIECITTLVVGKNFPDNAIENSKAIADENGLIWLQAEIGKSMPLPFFKDRSDNKYIFIEGSIIVAHPTCDECNEPFEGENNLCPWCSITEDQQIYAAQGNPLRMLDRLGRLDTYFAEVEKIKKSFKRP